MKKIDNFTNVYSLSKTLRFQLKPVGKTEENFEKKLLLETDEKRAEDYVEVKNYLDRYYRAFIDKALSQVDLDKLAEYEELYNKTNRSSAEEKQFKACEDNLRKQIASAFKNTDGYSHLFKKEIIRDILPNFLTNDEEKEIVKEFSEFTTYFTGFFQNRKNVFTADEKSTGVAYRCINENLPRYVDNTKTYGEIKELLGDQIEKLSNNMFDLYSQLSDITNIDDLFDVTFYSRFLSQFSIEIYNKIIGGYAFSDGTKVQGINELINLYNQKNKTRLPILKPLYKQILSESISVSFIPDSFSSDDELLFAVNEAYVSKENGIQAITEIAERLFKEIGTYDIAGINITSGVALTEISKKVLGNWHAIRDAWNDEYDSIHHPKKLDEKYYEKRDKEYKQIKSFNLEYIEKLAGEENRITTYYSDAISQLCKTIKENYKKAETLLTTDYDNKKRLYRNDKAITLIKTLLDSIKDLERLTRPLIGTGKENQKDERFYGEFLPLIDTLAQFDKLYDKVRNYLTQKPYSKEKIKLNFDNPQLLGGWDRNKESDYRSILLRGGNKYYLGIMDKTSNKAFIDNHYQGEEAFYEKMRYKLLAKPNEMLPKVFFADKNIDYFAPSDDILGIRKKESYKKGDTFNAADLRKFVDFYKQSIGIHPEWKEYGFEFTDTEKYENIGEFYKEVEYQGYSLTFEKVSKRYVDELVEDGRLYLFQIYNKDFSECSKGMPNLHTMYFKMLFDERNLADTVYKLNGAAEMFYRKASISDEEKIVHPANQAIKNKNPLTEKKESIFEYDIVKDKRFTRRSFMLHVPITLNFHAEGSDYINELVREQIRKCESNYVIGIDRGERNLLYVCVIDEKGNIVEQCSLNKIVNEYNKKEYTTDYHNLLELKEKDREKARQNWTDIENIKELKEGYLSQVIHKICELVEKYDAVIAMEDLNGGFKNSRKKVEKQVYQKFEKQLIDKLDYMVNKHMPVDENGGLLKAYQLANNGPKYINKGMQNGFIFYVPAWLTSKIDPVTGFVNLLNPRYTSITDAQAFFEKFDAIGFNEKENVFEFSFNYDSFPKGSTSYKKNWTVISNGERIKTFRNPEKNNEWDNQTIILTNEYKALFNKFGIPCSASMKTAIVDMNSKEFFEELLQLFRYTLQMRNSITGDINTDYLISPVKDKNGKYYDSRDYEKTENAPLPQNADANGAYNIARKALYMINIIRQSSEEEYAKAKLTITNKEWLELAQSND